MKNKSKTLLFFGNERLSTGFEPQGAPTLQALIREGYEIKAVIAHHSHTNSRTKRELEIEKVAASHHIPVYLPEKPTDIIDQITAYQPDAAVLVAYGKIIPQPIIDLFPQGIINIHPSLLPLYRGPTPIEQVIREGNKKTGVSLILLTSGMDSGPVFAQEEITLSGSETKFGLSEQLLSTGGTMLIKNLPAILESTLKPTSQDDTKATYTSLLAKKDGWLDITKPAPILEREVRAFFAWPKSRITFRNNDIIVLKSRVVTEKIPGKLIVVCAQNSFLEITELIAPSGKIMGGSDFIRGYLS